MNSSSTADPYVNDIRCADTDIRLFEAVTRIPLTETYFTQEVRDILYTCYQNCSNLPSESKTTLVAPFVKFFLHFSRRTSARDLLRTPEIRDLIINFFFGSHHYSPGSTAQLGEMISCITVSGKSAKATAELYSTKAALKAIIARFKNLHSEDDAKRITNAINNILIANPAAQIILNGLSVAIGFLGVVPFAKVSPEVAVGFIQMLYAFLNKNPTGQRIFSKSKINTSSGTPWPSIITELKYSGIVGQVHDEKSRQRTEAHMNEILGFISPTTTTTTITTTTAAFVDPAIVSAEPAASAPAATLTTDEDSRSRLITSATTCTELTRTLEHITKGRGPTVAIFSAFLRKKELIIDAACIRASATFLTWFVGQATTKIREAASKKHMKDFCDFFKNRLLGRSMKLESPEVVEVIFRSLSTCFDRHFCNPEDFATLLFSNALERSFAFESEWFWKVCRDIVVTEKMKVVLSDPQCTFARSFVAKFDPDSTSSLEKPGWHHLVTIHSVCTTILAQPKKQVSDTEVSYQEDCSTPNLVISPNLMISDPRFNSTHSLPPKTIQNGNDDDDEYDVADAFLPITPTPSSSSASTTTSSSSHHHNDNLHDNTPPEETPNEEEKESKSALEKSNDLLLPTTTTTMADDNFESLKAIVGSLVEDSYLRVLAENGVDASYFGVLDSYLLAGFGIPDRAAMKILMLVKKMNAPSSSVVSAPPCSSTNTSLNRAVADSANLIQKYHPRIIKTLEDDLTAEKLSHKKTTEQLARQAKRIAELEHEKTSLQSKLAACEEEKLKLNQNQKVKLSALEKEKSKLQSKFAVSTNENAKIRQTAERQQQELKNQLTSLRSQFQQEKSRLIQQHNAELSRVQAKLQQEAKSHSQTSSCLDQTKRDLQTYKESNHQKDASITSLYSRLSEKIHQAEYDLEQANDDRDHFQARSSSLQKQNTSLQAAKVKLEELLEASNDKIEALQSQFRLFSPFEKNKPYQVDFAVNGLPPAVPGANPIIREIGKNSIMFIHAQSLLAKAGRFVDDPTMSSRGGYKFGPVAGFTLERLEVIVQLAPGFEQRIRSLQNAKDPVSEPANFARNKTEKILRSQFLPRVAATTCGTNAGTSGYYSPLSFFTGRIQESTPPDFINVFLGMTADRVHFVANGSLQLPLGPGFVGSGIYATTSIEYAAKHARGDFDGNSQLHYHSPEDNPRGKNGCFPVLWCVAAVKNFYAVTREVDYTSNYRVSDWYRKKLKLGYDCHCVMMGSTHDGYQVTFTNGSIPPSQPEYMELVFDPEAPCVHPVAVLWMKEK